MAFHRVPDHVQRELDAFAGACRGYAGWAVTAEHEIAVDVIQGDGTPRRYTGANLRQALRRAREGEGC